MEAGFTEIEKQTGTDRENWGNELENPPKNSKKLLKGLKRNRQIVIYSSLNNKNGKHHQ